MNNMDLRDASASKKRVIDHKPTQTKFYLPQNSLVYKIISYSFSVKILVHYLCTLFYVKRTMLEMDMDKGKYRATRGATKPKFRFDYLVDVLKMAVIVVLRNVILED